ncbi:hypothetical protein PCANC_08869 [Puccinia coronata f. sp. avenae]|uniref:Uncharacterized protein n=1 Tax=Puccinia coronata f. sp. avenae TaxID=200324 RepID=A0A2N5SYX9_9BASI|nr:hypothetical protein PCANC_15772 [Puccinia coronata f. sp. avenae]PLW52830.1 hypothetical protein PCANC_08869 [Puccinia coronata f. sp. avenae]
MASLRFLHFDLPMYTTAVLRLPNTNCLSIYVASMLDQAIQCKTTLVVIGPSFNGHFHQPFSLLDQFTRTTQAFQWCGFQFCPEESIHPSHFVERLHYL